MGPHLTALEPAARFQVIRVPCASHAATFAGAVADGLGWRRKSLPCRFFYDDVGSHLFEAICKLPEYYPARTEEAILRAHAADVVAAAGSGVSLSEFGSGSSRKTRIIIEALLERQERLVYAPIDISLEFLEVSARRLLRRYRRLWLTAIGGEYYDAMPHLPKHAGPKLILFLGGNIGNLEHDEAARFLARVGRDMEASDRLLVGLDLFKPADVMLSAYNDSSGVTAAFNKNILARINRELGGEFELESFDHRAPFVERASRIEMHLVSRRDQMVRVAALGRTFAFSNGEAIHTESCHKYTIDGFRALASEAGLELRESWTDARRWFALAMVAAVRR
ncbi:MAG: L-histidine N(alpha)-methyltransferase [Vicinamibacterales bacterium]